MLKCVLLTALLLAFFSSTSQTTLLKSWIKVKTENLSLQEIEPDTLYTRYTLNKDDLRYSFYPGWDDYKQTWSQSEKLLTLGFATYTIEEHTDTSLVIAANGFRRFRLLAEEYLAGKKEAIDSIGNYAGKPLYRANRYVTPRYKKEGLRNEIQKNLEGLHGKDAAYFLATFVVTEEGKVENVQIVNGISEGFDREFAKQITKTSKQWRPAVVNGRPAQTLMSYEIKYLYLSRDKIVG